MKRTSLLVALSTALIGLSGCVAYPVGHSDYRDDRGYHRDGDRDHGRDQRDWRDDRRDDNRGDEPNCDQRLPDCRRH